MDQQFQTSFIPRKPSTVPTAPVSMPRTDVAPQMPPPRESSGGGSLLGLISGIIFVGSILSAVGVYAYNMTLTKDISSMIAQVDIAKKDYQKDLIATFEATDKRFKSAKEIFSNHIMVSPIFDTLQNLTLKTISFNNFSYTFNKVGNVEVKLSGKAQTYEAIALQSDTFSKNRFISDPVFSNLNLDEKGKISFDLFFVVDKTFVNYVDDTTRSLTLNTESTDNTNLQIPIETPIIK